MMRASILIPTRNRAGLLEAALVSIRAHAYEDTEVVVLDDASTDHTGLILARESWVRAERIERTGGYREDPAAVYNQLMGMATGEVLIQQSAEVVHITPVARQLAQACEPGIIVFATVLCGNYRQLAKVRWGVNAGWRGADYTWMGRKQWPIDPMGRRPDGGEGTAVPPPTVVVGGERVDAYTSAERPVPFFFCGAIAREDWLRTGGYQENIPHGASDLHLAIKMMEMGLKFRFLGDAVAYHIAHDKT